MKTEVERLEGNKVKLKVEVPSKQLDTALKDTYRDLAQRLYVPGFRRGKVPTKVIDAKIGKDAVVARAAETIITTRYPEAIVRAGVDPVEQPEVNLVQAEAGKDLIFEADIEVKPEAVLKEYKGVTVTVPNTNVTDEELQQQIDVLRNKFARLDVVEGRLVEKGDHVLIDYSGTLDGKPFDGSTTQDYMIEIGSGMLLEELEEGIIGAERGETRTIKASFPEDFRNTALAGKEAEFEVKVKEIKQKVLPEADDEFVSEMTEHDTLAELKEDLVRKLEAVKRAQSRVQAQSKVIDLLAEEADVSIPEKLVESELDTMMREMERSLKNQGATTEDYLKATKSTMEKLREELTVEARKRIVRELSIIAVAKAENIEVGQEELEAEIAEMARALGKPLREVQEQIAQKGTLPELHASLLRRKTLDWICTHANVVTESGEKVDMTPPKLEEEPETATAAAVKEPEAATTAATEEPETGVPADVSEAAAGGEEGQEANAPEAEVEEPAQATIQEGKSSE